MLLLDHFHPLLSRTHPWRAFHGAWAAAIARLLNHGILPPGFYAVPFVTEEGPIEIDGAALRVAAPHELIDGGGIVQAWTATSPALDIAIDLPAVDGVRVEVFSDEGDPKLAAAIELVSPRNKDRPAARQAFLGKCVGYLGRGCGLVLVDTVITRRADLNAELVGLLGGQTNGGSHAGLCSVSYVANAGPAGTRLLA